jgi:hypothetical protein
MISVDAPTFRPQPPFNRLGEAMSKDSGKTPGTPKGNPPGSGKAGKGPGNSSAKGIGTHPRPSRPVKGINYGRGPGPGNKGGKPPKT